MNPEVDTFLSKAKKWTQELAKLRAILLDCGLHEEIKWGGPCYTFDGNNVAIIGELTDCCVLSFFKGALLNDAEQILHKPGENTQAARVVKLTSVQQINKLEPTLKAYIYEAIEIEKAGLKVDFKEKTELIFSEELEAKFKENPALEKAFKALTPGRQRAYILHFTAPKQSRTRASRIEKSIQLILDGKGLNDW